MESGLELGSIVGLDDEHSKRQPTYDLVDESNRRSLFAGVVNLQHADSRAVVDGGELVQALPRAGDALEELDVHLWTVLLVYREALHAVLAQDAMHAERAMTPLLTATVLGFRPCCLGVEEFHEEHARLSPLARLR